MMRSSRLGIDWKYQLDVRGTVSSRPPVIGEESVVAVFIASRGNRDDGRLLCFDRATMQLRWESRHDDLLGNAVVTDSGDILCSMVTTRRVACFDQWTGARKWSWRTKESNIWEIAESDGRVVVGGVQGSAQSRWCIDAATGKTIWKFGTGGHSSGPLIYRNTVFQATGGTVIALNLDDGRVLWLQTESRTYLFNPTAFDGMVVIVGHGLFNVYDAVSGALLSQTLTDTANFIGPCTAVAGHLFFSDEGGDTYCYRVPQRDGDPAPTVLGSASSLAAMATNPATVENPAKGAVPEWPRLWKVASAGAVLGAPVVKDGAVFVIDGTNRVLALSPQDGSLIADLKLPGKAANSGVVDGGDCLYVAVGRHLYRLTFQG
jgi:outer membrane protein assembly factor BamB